MGGGRGCEERWKGVHIALYIENCRKDFADNCPDSGFPTVCYKWTETKVEGHAIFAACDHTFDATQSR